VTHAFVISYNLMSADNDGVGCLQFGFVIYQWLLLVF